MLLLLMEARKFIPTGVCEVVLNRFLMPSNILGS